MSKDLEWAIIGVWNNCHRLSCLAAHSFSNTWTYAPDVSLTSGCPVLIRCIENKKLKNGLFNPFFFQTGNHVFYYDQRLETSLAIWRTKRDSCLQSRILQRSLREHLLDVISRLDRKLWLFYLKINCKIFLRQINKCGEIFEHYLKFNKTVFAGIL